MVSFKNIFLISSATLSATALQKRAAIAQVIDTNVKSLITTTSAYSGGILAALPLLTDLTAVYIALLEGDVDSGLLPSISESDTYALINHVNQTLAIDNPSAVSTLISKKAYFQDVGLDDFVVAALGLLKAGHESFSRHVLERIPADTVALATEVIEVIDATLQEGIDAFEATN